MIASGLSNIGFFVTRYATFTSPGPMYQDLRTFSVGLVGTSLNSSLVWICLFPFASLRVTTRNVGMPKVVGRSLNLLIFASVGPGTTTMSGWLMALMDWVTSPVGRDSEMVRSRT